MKDIWQQKPPHNCHNIYKVEFRLLSNQSKAKGLKDGNDADALKGNSLQVQLMLQAFEIDSIHILELHPNFVIGIT